MIDPLIVAGTAVACALLAVAALAARHRGRPGAVPFVLMTAFLAAMTAGATSIAVGAVEPDSRWTLVAFTIPFTFASLSWIALAFEYTGRGPAVTRRRAAALVGVGVGYPAFLAAGTVVPDWLSPFWTFVVNVVDVTLLAATGYGAFLVARSVVEYDDLPRSGSLMLTTAGGGFIAVIVIILFGQFLVSHRRLWTVVVGFLGGIAGLLLVALVRYRVFDAGPGAGHLARETVLDEMSAAVAITDREDGVLDLNRTAERTFGTDRGEAIGDPVADAIGVDPVPTGDRPTAIETDEGRRQFDVTRSTLTSRGGDPVGRAYLLRDVTERRTREQRLDVLNRVLRHNLRNDLDAIRGFAETLERGAADDEQGIAARIRDAAEDLADLGTAFERAERILADEAVEYERVDVAALAREVAADAGAEGAVTVSVPASEIEVRTDRRILETVLGEVVENAVEHGVPEGRAAGDGSVEVTVEAWGPGAELRIADEGPGIPERERAVLLEGEETPLRHGSGVGLWLVYWGVTRLGGDLAFSENDPRGSVVTLRIPDR